MKDNKNDLISPEIIKLTEKIARDPSSTLFLPLAEEYRKCGMLDEAIILLTDGLKHHPNFLSAMVSLGKIYLQKGLIPEAKSEFEKVIQSTPDNLLAQKKLAIIYKDEGNVDAALESCRKLLLLNPNDEEIKKIKSELEVVTEEEVGAGFTQEEKKEPGKSATVIEEKTIEKDGHTDESTIFNPEEIVPEKGDEEEIESESSPVYEIKEEDIDLKEIFRGEPETTSEAGVKDIGDKTEKDSALSDIFKTTPDEGEKEEEIPVYEIKDTDEEVSLDNILVGREKVEDTNIFEVGTSVNDQSVLNEAAGEEVKEELKADREDRSTDEEIASEALVELYIKQEHFDKAIEILKILLGKDPFNETLRQKMEDAVTLKNLMGGEALEGMSGGHDALKEEPLIEEEIGISEPAGEVLESPMVAGNNRSETVSAEDREEETMKTNKVKRLEQWLENIKRSHGK